MSEQTIQIEELNQTPSGMMHSARKQIDTLSQTARRTALAGVGAVLLVGDEVGNLIVDVKERVHQRSTSLRDRTGKLTDELVERGSRVQHDVQVRFEQRFEQRRSDVAETADDAGSRLSKTVSNVLERLNIPTRDAIDSLNKNVAALGRKVDKLRKTQEQSISA